MSYCYDVHGLVVQSEIELPYLKLSSGRAPDIEIALGAIEAPQSWEHALGSWKAGPGWFLIEVEGMARMMVREGGRIQVEPAPGASSRDVVACVQGSGLAAALQQRRILPLHACAVQTDKGALLVAGRSGAGKSTLLGGLLALGFPMMADDVSAIDFDENGRAMVSPAFPATRLWRDSVMSLGVEAERLDPVRVDMEKYYLPVDRFCAEPQPFFAMVALSEHNGADVLITSVRPTERVACLVQNSFRRRFLRGHGLLPFQFEAATRAAPQIEMARLARPSRGTPPTELAERIVAHFNVAPPA